MKKTAICDRLGIEYPIVQAPMAWITPAEFAAAVSNAGGLGTIGPMAGIKGPREAGDADVVGERLREQIRKARSLTSKPFSANVPVGRGGRAPISDRMVDVIIEEKPPVVIVVMGSPALYTKRLKAAGIFVMHAVGSVKHAQFAEAQGVDAVICEGYEGGGHLGGEELTTFVMTPQVADAVKIPVVAGGGIGDARGLVAALALGASAAYVGTRFMATIECPVHPNMKQAILDAIDTSTIAFGRKTGLSRCLKNEYTREHVALEAGGSSFEEMREYERSGTPSLQGRRRVPAALIDGNVVHGSAAMGAVAGLVKEVVSVADLIQSMVKGADEILKRLA
ncbi:MAG: nitronate monooxygenase [Chloroflexi bacterium]|nr:nitronate monooxygenase [Chloroflexota bacterium]